MCCFTACLELINRGSVFQVIPSSLLFTLLFYVTAGPDVKQMYLSSVLLLNILLPESDTHQQEKTVQTERKEE